MLGKFSHARKGRFRRAPGSKIFSPHFDCDGMSPITCRICSQKLISILLTYNDRRNHAFVVLLLLSFIADCDNSNTDSSVVQSEPLFNTDLQQLIKSLVRIIPVLSTVYDLALNWLKTDV